MKYTVIQKSSNPEYMNDNIILYDTLEQCSDHMDYLFSCFIDKLKKKNYRIDYKHIRRTNLECSYSDNELDVKYYIGTTDTKFNDIKYIVTIEKSNLENDLHKYEILNNTYFNDIKSAMLSMRFYYKKMLIDIINNKDINVNHDMNNIYNDISNIYCNLDIDNIIYCHSNICWYKLSDNNHNYYLRLEIIEIRKD